MDKSLSLSFVPIIVVALLFGAYLSYTVPTGSPVPKLNSLPATSDNTTSVYIISNQDLRLSLSVNATTLMNGQVISVNITEYNTLPRANNVPSQDNWTVSGLTLGGCGMLNYPFGIAVFKGYYNQNNLSSLGGQKSLLIYHPGIYNCPAIFIVKSYQFEPSSNLASIETGSTFPVSVTLSVSGGWSGGNALGVGSVLQNFSPGTYTVIGGDEWGSLVMLHFAVS